MRSCDGRKKVEEMLKLCDNFEDLQYIACLRPLQQNQDIEHARQDCLEQLITALTKNEPSLKGIIFEARRSQSDNDKDRNTLKCQMRVFGTGVLGTRYCRVPGSWYRAEGYVGPGR